MYSSANFASTFAHVNFCILQPKKIDLMVFCNDAVLDFWEGLSRASMFVSMRLQCYKCKFEFAFEFVSSPSSPKRYYFDQRSKKLKPVHFLKKFKFLGEIFDEIKSVHFKKTVVRSSFLSKLWYFSIYHQQTLFWCQLMLYWKVPQFWKKWGSCNCLLKMNGL